MDRPKFEHCYIYEGNMEWNLQQFLGGEFKKRCHTQILPLKAEFAFSEEPEPFENIPNLTFQPIQVGEVWSKTNFACAWFHVTGKLPDDIDRKDLYLDFSNDVAERFDSTHTANPRTLSHRGAQCGSLPSRPCTGPSARAPDFSG